MNTYQQKPDFTSSGQMESSERSDHILTLGRKLVDCLGLEPSVDTLGRWMVHYISGLMAEVEVTTGEKRIDAEKKCFEAILTLWKHRRFLPNGLRPFEDLEPFIRAIESLDPESDLPRYFQSSRQPNDVEESDGNPWIAMVNELDYSAKVLIRYCFVEAAHDAVDNSKEWVQLAQAAGEESDAAEIMVSFISREDELRKESNPNDVKRKILQDRIKRLENFAKLSQTVLHDLKSKLDNTGQPD